MTDIQKIKDYLLKNPEFLTGGYKEVAERFGVTYDSVNGIAKRLREKQKLEVSQISELNNQKVETPEGFKGILKGGKTWQVHDGSWRESLRFEIDQIEQHKIFKDEFEKFLVSYKPEFTIGVYVDFHGEELFKKHPGCLILNKQDAHLNKFDIHGNNDIDKRFESIEKAVNLIVGKSISINNIDEIIYVIGSDQFNSEWTGMTTKGTPQQNILSYQESFKKICDHELKIFEVLKSIGKLKVIYVPGNHDEFIGFHLINWLKAVCRNEKNISFDDTTAYRKYLNYGTSTIMFNHGDAIKPAKLANLFPIENKVNWSKADNYYIFTGDKHHEMSLDFNGIKFYQLPALSNSKSLWDDKNGYTASKAELTAFIIQKDKGMSTILKEIL